MYSQSFHKGALTPELNDMDKISYLRYLYMDIIGLWDQ